MTAIGMCFSAAVLAGALALMPAARAQQPGGMAGMPMQGHDMSGMGSMNMGGMMRQCAQMRQQMKPGVRMTADMQTMMRRCDGMDRQMGSTPSDSATPRTRTR